MTYARPDKRRRLDRISAACDLCKARKVKCDGELPCAYCKRKNHSDSCTFSGPKTRQAKSTTNTPANRGGEIARDQTSHTPRERRYTDPDLATHSESRDNVDFGPSVSPTLSRGDHHDTAVPLEARLLRDGQGKAIFIGDCAPISFLQTVRHLVASKADPFPAQASRESFVEIAQPEPTCALDYDAPDVHPREIDAILQEYHVATSGLVDLFERDKLVEDVQQWVARAGAHAGDVATAVNYLVLAIGIQESNERKAEAWFTQAKRALMGNFVASMHLGTVQGFVLVTVYMLRAFQPNGAYLYFCESPTLYKLFKKTSLLDTIVSGQY